MIKELKPGDELISFFILRKKEIKTKRDSDENYLSLEFGDASGRIGGTVWENVQKLCDTLAKGDIVKVKGKVINYKDRLHLTVRNIRAAVETDEYDLAQLVPVVEKDRDALMDQLNAIVESVHSPYLKKLLEDLFLDKKIHKSFKDAPAGKLWHHNYLGGLLEHTLAVVDICDKMSHMYPNLKRDLLIAGALLHDIGKIYTYTYKTLIDFTDKGRLIGHIVLGAQLVREKIKSIQDFPPTLEMELIHLILSHQGKLEQASPVMPMTLEGLILYYADELDSKANAFLRIMKKEKSAGVNWSSYVQLLNRHLYLGDEERQLKNTNETNTLEN